ncbi:Oidioi.mRNA.OKI2018_I69.PAR.g11128.t1.cds [Oikopleura dioica]|uniref:Oidioi.mRNA.OKI2018_I69.PAR.g11128.t1.cds n=1 Tax=Oikopleura dioica TaxID=34765 RepID=A0ABN7RZ28_OIKDI|nr:Oidioi.mRNA.OKI2018_I69.PAR.g11128.t1.cds [Oikopleura dioica]
MDTDWTGYVVGEQEMMMRKATSPHHTNPRSATLDFWRKTSTINEYRKIQYVRRKQTNIPTSSNHYKEEHLVIAQKLAAMEKRRVGTRFLDHEITEKDMAKPLLVSIKDSCALM